jgi:acetyltransferase
MMPLQHYLRPLLAPTSVALVGATHRAGTVGRVLLENLVAGGFAGEVHFVNPHHKRVLGKKCFASLRDIGKPVELALIAVPCAAVPLVLEDGAHAGVAAAVIHSAPPVGVVEARRWEREVTTSARKRRIRLLGAHAFGVIRTDIGLNATMGAVVARPGRLALIAQSGAVCTAMLNFATPLGIGFSTVLALGAAYDVGFGELLDALVQDPTTDGILLYVESVRDARRFMSALRAAARTKPVVVLRAGRSKEKDMRGSGAPSPDAVFDAAMKRAGTVRAMTYTQLFSAARILAMGRIPHSDRLAIVTNGRGPGTLAADSAWDRGVPLAVLTPDTEAALARILPAHMPRSNPVNVRGDAPPALLAAAVATTLRDPNVDAVLALHVDRPLAGATEAARAVAVAALGASKPVLGAWLGSIERPSVRDALRAGGIPDFYTPENAVDAFSFLAAYRRNQAWLLEVPPPQPEPRPIDIATVERIRDAAARANRTLLTDLQTHRLLGAFDLPVTRADTADTLKETLLAARKLGYPVTLKLDAPGLSAKLPQSLARTNLRDGRMLTRAYGELQDGVRRAFPREDVHAGVIVRKEVRVADTHDVAIAVHTDEAFGPVITFGNSGAIAEGESVVLLPPLNERLVLDAIGSTRALQSMQAGRASAPSLGPLVRVLLQLSSLVCALPWVRTLTLDPVRVGDDGVVIAGAHVTVDLRRRAAATGYRHMAIHPYPIELVGDARLRDGSILHVRPIRPEDARLETDFVNGLSEETRYFRFFYRLHELTPAMLARFTQVDYDRELAMVAVDDGNKTNADATFVGVARYIMNPDGESAEFAVVIADAWQGRGVGRVLMERLIESAKRRRLSRLEGAVLRANANMRKFCAALGFVEHDDRGEPEQVMMVLDLAASVK